MEFKELLDLIEPLDLQKQIIVAVILLLCLIIFSIKRNNYADFILGFIFLTSWMIVTIALPFVLIRAFSLEGLILFFILFTLYTIYGVMSNFFCTSSISEIVDDIKLIKLDKAIQVQLKAMYLTIINTVVMTILVLAILGVITFSPVVLLASIWAIPLALMGVIAGTIIFGVLMIGLIPSVIVNIIYVINGATQLVNALEMERKEKIMHILFSLIPYYSIVNGFRLYRKANKIIESNGFKFSKRKLKFVEILRE